MSHAAERRSRPSALTRLAERIARIEDGAIMRFAFFALLIGTLSVLYIDYRELSAAAPLPEPVRLQPILPPVEAGGEEGIGTHRPDIVSAPEALENPLAIALRSGGELHLTGTFDPGSGERFAAEIAARGEYVETVVLESPGGSVADALAIGALIHEKGYATRVDAGRLCASSCPIVFASGTERIAAPAAAIGVHQVYAAGISGDVAALTREPAMAMAEAQETTAEITRHLTLTGVDPALWLHALETPPDRLYYFSPEEMTALNLVTKFADEL
jgi:hypothetical protein